MKKKLEAELISIAHRVLKLKNKSELIQLQQETLKLYEKLSVLRFVEENFDDVKPTIGIKEIEKKLEIIFEEEVETKPTTEEETVSRFEELVKNTLEDTKQEEIQPSMETFNEINEPEIISNENELIESEEQEKAAAAEEEETVSRFEELVKDTLEDTKQEPIESSIEESKNEFKPAFELSFETLSESNIEEPKKENTQISFEDILGSNYIDPIFVKPEELEKEKLATNTVFSSKTNAIETSIEKDTINFESQPTTTSSKISKGITIGLNDRVAFIKHLFANNTEDYNRVLSQLITFDSLQETEEFINDMVKPDYNNWEGKDEYTKRFMEVIERRFS